MEWKSQSCHFRKTGCCFSFYVSSMKLKLGSGSGQIKFRCQTYQLGQPRYLTPRCSNNIICILIRQVFPWGLSELIKVNCLEDTKLIQCAIIIIMRLQHHIYSVLTCYSSAFFLTIILTLQLIVDYKCWHLYYPHPIRGLIPAWPWFCLKIWTTEAQTI